MTYARKLFPLLTALSILPLFSGCDSDDSGGGAPAPGSFTLTVTKNGGNGGTGLVTSLPAGISCGGSCSASYAAGTSVSLSAAPDPGSVFAGWSGTVCSGTGGCTVPMSAAQTVNAIFNLSGGPALPGDVVALTTTDKLISFNRSTPDIRFSGPVAITGLGAGESVVGIDYRPNGNKLYGVAKGTNVAKVYELNPLTGAATNPLTLCTNVTDATTCAASMVALSGAEFGVDFNPVVDRLRIVGNDGQNLRVNVDSGATIVDAVLSGGNATAAAYTNNFPGPAGTVAGTILYVIDTSGTTDTLFTMNTATGALTPVGNLGVDATNVNGFEISGSGVNSTEAIAAMTVSGIARLFRIDLATGAAVTIATVSTGDAAGTAVKGLASPAVGTFLSAGDAFALIGASQLVSFNRATPATIRNRVLVTGLNPGDQVVAIDIRPKDRKLYALGKLANIYTLDTNSGAAALVTALTPDPADADDPKFAGLNANANFGIDFNPATDSSKADPPPPSLRIVESTGQNLRVPVEGANLGKVIRDLDTNRDNPAAELDPTAPQQITQPVTASGYTNGFGGAANTTLYAIDSATDRLATQALANNNAGIEEGELTNVGDPFGFDAEGVNGFDVDALTGESFAALRVAGLNKLFQVNLASGVPTERGAIGDGSLDVRGLALKVPAPAIVFGLTDKTDLMNNLVTFDPLLPGTLLTGPTPIRGLAGGDELIGIDFRPADKVLIAVSKAGNIYSVEAIATTPPGGALSHAATLITSMKESINDPSPFNQLVGTEFGYDFDPTLPSNASGLRIVGDGGTTASYARTNSLTGETFTDTTLARPGPVPATPPCDAATGDLAIGAAAYSGNATLFVIDANPNAPCLYTASAAGGPISQIGFLFAAPPPVLDAGAIAGFDIAGTLNGLVLAALDPAGATAQSLYPISLASNSISPRAGASRGTIGPAGTPRLRSIAIQLLPPQ